MQTFNNGVHFYQIFKMWLNKFTMGSSKLELMIDTKNLTALQNTPLKPVCQ